MKQWREGDTETFKVVRPEFTCNVTIIHGNPKDLGKVVRASERFTGMSVTFDGQTADELDAGGWKKYLRPED